MSKRVVPGTLCASIGRRKEAIVIDDQTSGQDLASGSKMTLLPVLPDARVATNHNKTLVHDTN